MKSVRLKSALMVIVPDRISEILEKGEYTPRYYNPGNLFEEVHIVATNDDAPDLKMLQRTVGGARLHFHNIPADNNLFYATLGWRPGLLNGWARQGIDLARRIDPSLIRCHGNHLNAYLAKRIKDSLSIPYVVSMHINPDEDRKKRASGLREHIAALAAESVGIISLRAADLVLPVYRPIIPYLVKRGVRRFEVVYNILNRDHLRQKADYRLHEPVRIISVGRQFKEKNPGNIILALKEIGNVHLTLVGDGPYHEFLKELSRKHGLDNRVTFIRAQANDQLCRELPEYDIFAVHTEYWELSKSVIEPLLTGLPLVINKRIGEPVPELEGDFVVKVNNTVGDYGDAFRRLISNNGFRETMGKKACAYAWDNWSPLKMEEKVVAIYNKLMRDPR
jgi:glycosyltransferase involved in cell wall biosynthesis